MRCYNCLAKLVLKYGVPLTYDIPVASLYYSIQHYVIQCVSDLRWFSHGTPVSSNKVGHHDITEILLKVALSTINQPNVTLLVYMQHNRQRLDNSSQNVSHSILVYT